MTLDPDKLAALHEAATPGPLVAVRLAHVVTHREGASERVCYTPEDDALLLYLRNAVPDILAIIAERDKLKAELMAAANNLGAGSDLYSCPGLHAAALRARAAIKETEA